MSEHRIPLHPGRGEGESLWRGRAGRGRIALASGGKLVTGKAKIELAHLDGRANPLESPAFYTGYSIKYRARAEWVARQDGDSVCVTATSTKAGQASLEVTLAAEA